MDPELVKKILLAFEDSSVPFLNIKQVCDSIGMNMGDEPFYHLDLLLDKGLITRRDGKQGLGIYISPDASALSSISLGVEFRLTADGHEFLGSIKKSQIWEKLKKVTGEMGLEAMKDGAKFMAKQLIESQLA